MRLKIHIYKNFILSSCMFNVHTFVYILCQSSIMFKSLNIYRQFPMFTLIPVFHWNVECFVIFLFEFCIFLESRIAQCSLLICTRTYRNSEKRDVTTSYHFVKCNKLEGNLFAYGKMNFELRFFVLPKGCESNINQLSVSNWRVINQHQINVSHLVSFHSGSGGVHCKPTNIWTPAGAIEFDVWCMRSLSTVNVTSMCFRHYPLQGKNRWTLKTVKKRTQTLNGWMFHPTFQIPVEK